MQSEIPEDVMKAAQDAFAKLADTYGSSAAMVFPIARAIMTERERHVSTILTGEMIEAAKSAYSECEFRTDEQVNSSITLIVRAALEAALSTDAEPVAWQFVYLDGTTSLSIYAKEEAEDYERRSPSIARIRPLYAGPVKTAPAVAVKDAKAEAEALADRAGIDIGDDRDMFIDDLADTLTRFAALSAQVQEARNADEDEIYEIGVREGYERAVQEIDIKTGGDGEYRYCTDHDPDRHTPDAPAMIQRIVDRFETLNLIGEAEKRGDFWDVPGSAQVQDVAGWRPIETAPRDGSEFQAWIKDYGWEPKARINLSTEAFEIWGRIDYDEEGWAVYPYMFPTHWMPLPTSPASKHGGS